MPQFCSRARSGGRYAKENDKDRIPMGISLQIKDFTQKLQRVVGISNAVSDGPYVGKDFKIVSALEDRTQTVGMDQIVTRDLNEQRHTSKVLSPKKCTSSHPVTLSFSLVLVKPFCFASSSKRIRAYVLSHPLGKTSKEICPPILKRNPQEPNSFSRAATNVLRTLALRSYS